MSMTPKEAEFYIALQNWIDDGCGPHEHFLTEDSLCFAYENFTNGGSFHGEYWAQWGLRSLTPFNAGGLNELYGEWENETVYQNPARLKFIADRAAEARA